ncbi:hypothetical protein B9Z19DRAFT_1123666 [Tuber borchii]|uniref:Uncharacterized protein n=1 Tax=Tuber borchii TaxID=42251 RepID=A0A2T6ZY59_TUBBO|nr:hypothetical protein B9Z19DRAFT_1123666 [Tuber borchii]
MVDTLIQSSPIDLWRSLYNNFVHLGIYTLYRDEVKVFIVTSAFLSIMVFSTGKRY